MTGDTSLRRTIYSADRTLERFDSCVAFHVSFDFIVTRKTFITDLAFIGTFSRVQTDVDLVFMPVPERTSAMRTNVRFFTGVITAMNQKTFRVGEPSSTALTLIGRLFGM